MSSASTTGVPRDDFWELTNFGTNTIELATCWFRDSGGFSGAANLGTLWAVTREDEPRIGPGESILFVKLQPGVTDTPEDFRHWWGDAQLPPDLKILFYNGFGFSSPQDAVLLWQVTAGRTNLVHRVEWFRSQVGRTFTYDPVSGVLDRFSLAGMDRGFVAATTDDVGSPGWTIGPVPLLVVQAPASTEVDGGAPVTLAVQAYGLPVPQYQWRFNDVSIPGATSRTFTLAAATISNAGPYTVELDNGLEQVVTPPATLTVNTQASCARIVRPMADIEVTPGQTAIFRVEVRGYPLPTFRWQLEGADIPGATASTYSVVGVSESRTGLYTVHITNPLCMTNISARLRVVPVPDLRITEAMASPTNRVLWGHDTWWELTNCGTNAVNLRGYRWDDTPPSLEGAVQVNDDVILLPGKSAIFVSTISREAFRRWWGEEYLPADLPIISYPGNGLASLGDLIRVWNATALAEDDWLVSEDPLNLEAGLSQWFDKAACESGCVSIEGENGAFRADEGGDIGSPGWTTNEQRVMRPRVTLLRREASGTSITWKTQPDRSYELRYRNDLQGTTWMLLRSLRASSNSLTVVDDTTASTSQRFYKVILLPPSP